MHLICVSKQYVIFGNVLGTDLDVLSVSSAFLVTYSSASGKWKAVCYFFSVPTDCRNKGYTTSCHVLCRHLQM